MMAASGNKAGADWRDALAALRPQDSENSEHSENSENSDNSQSSQNSHNSQNSHSAPSAHSAHPAQSSPLLITYERKGRGGKQATIISGFECDEERLRDIASTLKQRLATGGSARGGEILVQGDRRADAAALLRSMGFKVKGA